MHLVHCFQRNCSYYHRKSLKMIRVMKQQIKCEVIRSVRLPPQINNRSVAKRKRLRLYICLDVSVVKIPIRQLTFLRNSFKKDYPFTSVKLTKYIFDISTKNTYTLDSNIFFQIYVGVEKRTVCRVCKQNQADGTQRWLQGK